MRDPQKKALVALHVREISCENHNVVAGCGLPSAVKAARVAQMATKRRRTREADPDEAEPRDAGCSEAALTQVADGEEFAVTRRAVAFGIRQGLDGLDERGK